MTSNTGIPVTFYKCDGAVWSQLDYSVNMYCHEYSLSLRDTTSFTLLFDFPFQSISKCEYLKNENIVKFTIKSSDTATSMNREDQYATKIDDEKVIEEYLKFLANHGVAYQCIDVQTADDENFEMFFPNMNNPEFEEYILRLLFNGRFREFARDMSDFVLNIEDMIAKEDSDEEQ